MTTIDEPAPMSSHEEVNKQPTHSSWILALYIWKEMGVYWQQRKLCHIKRKHIWVKKRRFEKPAIIVSIEAKHWHSSTKCWDSFQIFSREGEFVRSVTSNILERYPLTCFRIHTRSCLYHRILRLRNKILYIFSLCGHKSYDLRRIKLFAKVMISYYI